MKKLLIILTLVLFATGMARAGDADLRDYALATLIWMSGAVEVRVVDCNDTAMPDEPVTLIRTLGRGLTVEPSMEQTGSTALSNTIETGIARTKPTNANGEVTFPAAYGWFLVKAHGQTKAVGMRGLLSITHVDFKICEP